MIQFIKHYIPYLKNYKRQLFFAFLGMLTVAITTAAIAYMMKPLLDEIFVDKKVEQLYILPVIVIAIFALKGIGTYVQAYYMNLVGQDIVRIVRDKMLQHVLTLDMSFFHLYHSGELLSRITNDVNRIQGAVSTQLALLVRESFTALALIGVVIYHSPTLAFFVFVVIPAAYIPVQIISKKLKKISHASQEKNSDLTSNLNETFSNIEIIKAYSTQAFEAKKFAVINKSFFEINMRSIKIGELVIPVMELFAAISAAIVIIVGGKEVINGNMTIGAFFSFLTAMFMAVDPIRRVSTTYARFQDALAANERINDIMIIESKTSDGEKELCDVKTITFNNAYLSYEDKPALKNINFTLQKGEVIAFVGNSGGGKSSIINLMLRFFDPTKGSILMNNEDIKTYSLHSLREQISIVTQRVYIFNDTIATNVAYGDEIDEEKIIEVLKKANIYEHIQTMEDGIYTELNESGTNLSGGQRQRIAIARALYKNPKILILDEATSALDNTSEKAIIQTIQNISKDIITIMIAHRFKSIDIASKLFVLSHGEIVGEGTKEKLLESCAEFKELYKDEQ